MRNIKLVFASIKHIANNMHFLLKTSFRMFKQMYFLTGFKSIFSTVAPFINLYFPKYILDELAAECRWRHIVFLIFLWALINGAITLITELTTYIFRPYEDKNSDKEREFWNEINADMEYSKLENGAVADEKNRISSNIWLFGFQAKIIEIISIIIQLAGYTYIIATVHPCIIAFIFVIIYLNSVVSKKTQNIDFEYQKIIPKYGRAFNYLFNVLISFSYAKEVRINNATALVQSKYKENEKEYMGIYKDNLKKSFSIGVLSDVIMFCQILVIYGYGGYRAAKGEITIGDFTIFTGAVVMLISGVGSLISQILAIKHQSDYVDSYIAFTDAVIPKEPENCVKEINKNTPEIEFINVSFKYPGCDSYVLKNVSFKIKNGERLCIVGYNGAGKSTLIKLICKLYQPTEGRILFNGTDISKIRNEEYMPLLSVVFQDFNIYALSLKDNICLDRVFEEKRFYDAVTLCGLYDKLMTLPFGIETQITREYDENGIELSGGEGQKLATARAYYKNAPLVVLDEPTASLDPISESNMYKCFNSIIGNKTAIYISHRLASVKFCDNVLVMADGKVIGYGTHDELMSNNEIYREMYLKQSEYYNDTEIDIG